MLPIERKVTDWMIEIEMKFAVSAGEVALLQNKILALPFVRPFEPVTNDDVYYDTANFDCFRQAVFVRIRNHQHLEVKFHDHTDPMHEHASERVFPLDADASLMWGMNSLLARFLPRWQEAQTIEQGIALNGLTKFVQIQNHRTRYRYQDVTLCIDRVEGLGDFFEIEILCTKEIDIALSIDKLQAFVAFLAFSHLNLVKIGYVELWLKLHCPQVYLLGKYQEDGN